MTYRRTSQQNGPSTATAVLAKHAGLIDEMNYDDPDLNDPAQTPAEGKAPMDNTGLGGDAGRIAELEKKLAELSDLHLRAKAEVENVRRRAEEDLAKARKFAVEAFAESLLPVRDSLEAAVALPGAAADHMLEGVHATLRQLSSAFDRNKVTQIDPSVGSKFDPHQHQAITVVPSEHEANSVVSVLQKGYLIADRVLRPALVTVSAPK